MLIIKACGAKGEDHECEIIEKQAKMYGITTKIITPKTVEELEAGLKTDRPYDFIYLSSHGNEEGLCNHDESLNITWIEFGTLLCDTECMKEECILMLSCCRGGLNQVAYDLFYSCKFISYVVGPRRSLESYDMQISYSMLLYLLVRKDADPVVACEKIKAATDIRFFFFDRLEVEGDANYSLRVHENDERFEAQWEEEEKEKQQAGKEENKIETSAVGSDQLK